MTLDTTPASRTIDRGVRLADVLTSPDARAVIETELPELIASGAVTTFAGFPLGAFLQVNLASDAARVERVLDLLAAIPDPTPPLADDALPAPSPDYEGDTVRRASARLTLPTDARVHERVELVLDGPSHGDPFVDVDVAAVFAQSGTALRVGGFYDGDGTYRVRFLPPAAGDWTVTLSSNARSLDGIEASINVRPSDGRPGPVRVDGSDGFAHADGSVFLPVGTTAYAWTHQPEALQEDTLRSLAAAPFTKLRMGLFPKSFIYNENEPDRFVFPRAVDGGWDLRRFDLEYFRALERRIDQLAAIGVEADLILFHPYDRWGFSALGPSADDRYVTYVVRRLAAFSNVWWSLANEYELVTAKRTEDWHRIGRLVRSEDHVGHPLSVHNILEPWDATADWVTHCSIQRSDPSIGERVDEWRARFAKPVVVDEMGYEGDLDQGWGSLTADEMLLRCWQVAMRGGSYTHGETYWSDDEIVFWAKGGTLRGESPERIAFLQELIAASPTGRIAPLPSQFDASWAGVPGQYVLIHFGRGRPRFRFVPIPEGHVAVVEVVDAWDRTVERLPGSHSGTIRVDLPAKQHVLIRLLLEPADA